MLRKSITFFVCLALTRGIAAQTTSTTAKPESSQESFVFQRLQEAARFENDGTGTRESTAVIRVQSQAGVQQLGQLIFGYSTATEDLQIDYVRVRKPDGRLIETLPATAQDFAPEILRQAPMYSDYRERHVSVASLQAGDVLEYHTVTHVKPLAPGEFWYEHSFVKQAFVEDESLEIDIPKARAVKLKSTEYKYETHETGDRRTYAWSIKNFVPERNPREANDEIDLSDLKPDVQLSTFSDWQEVARWYAQLQGERVVVNEQLRSKAAELTKDATTPTEKARRLYDYVARSIRYVSLSFGVGRLQPHEALEVLQNGYGDCKDKHTLLQALLRVEGIESYPVLINSYRKLDPDMPSPAQFDHVITAARLDKGALFTWLDSTAEVAPFGLILYPLRNKQALLASDDANSGLHRTPAESPIKNLVTLKIDGKFTETGALDAAVDLTAQGDSDVPIRAELRRLPETNWKSLLELLSASWGMTGDVSDSHIDALEDTTQPLHIRYHLHRDNYFRVPNPGANFALLPSIGRRGASRTSRKNPSEPIDVGPAAEEVYRARIQFPSNYTIHVPPEVRMSRDFGEYSATYVVNRDVLDAQRRLVLRANELPPSRRIDYESFRTTASGTLEQTLWCSITPPSAAAVAAVAQTTGTPAELRSAGAAALQRRDFGVAADLLKRAADVDPKQANIWDDLGRAYVGLNQPDLAVGAFRKQAEIDPYNSRANSDLAAELQQQGKLDDALAAYKKQLEIVPSDRLTHKNLGLLLAQMRKDEEARAELETAAALPPEDPQVQMALAQVYSRIGSADKAQALMNSVMGTSAAISGPDVFGPVLRDDIDPNVALHDGRKTLASIGDQFESGDYDRLGPQVFTAMNFVALAWARIGWAKSMQGEMLESIQYLNASWMLSQSGTVANRLARVFEKEGQKEKARHMFALAVAAGGPEAQASREQLSRLLGSPDGVDKEIAQAGSDLVQSRTLKLPTIPGMNGAARFGLVFDSSNQPERAEYLDGDASLRSAGDKLREKEYPVKFPDVSSVKIVQRATVTCDGSGCVVALLPLDKLQP